MMRERKRCRAPPWITPYIHEVCTYAHATNRATRGRKEVTLGVGMDLGRTDGRDQESNSVLKALQVINSYEFSRYALNRCAYQSKESILILFCDIIMVARKVMKMTFSWPAHYDNIPLLTVLYRLLRQ